MSESGFEVVPLDSGPVRVRPLRKLTSAHVLEEPVLFDTVAPFTTRDGQTGSLLAETDAGQVAVFMLGDGSGVMAHLRSSKIPVFNEEDEELILGDEFEKIEPGEDISSNEFLVSTLSLRPAITPGVSTLETARSFLYQRYFGLLYRRSLPLQVFAKTAIPRIRALCNDNKDRLLATLSSLIIQTIGEFDRRHEISASKNGLLSAPFIHAEEESYRHKFISGNIETEEDTRTEDTKEADKRLEEKKDPVERLHVLLLALKEREARLQIMMLLELLAIVPSSRSSSRASTPEAKPKVKRRLVGRKKRAVVSTIGLGGVLIQPVSPSTSKPEQEHAWSEETIKANLLAYFDRLCVWDALSGRGSTHDDSAFKFMMVSVVPYIRKSHNKLIKEILLRIKGPSLNSVERRQKKPKESTTAPPLAEPIPVKKLDLPISLKRSSSTLGSAKDLAKKSFDMTIKTPSFSQKPPHPKPIAPETIFTSSQPLKKRRLGASARTSSSLPTTSLTQIKATPAKSDRVRDVLLPEVQATPVQKPKTLNLQVEATPLKDSSVMSPLEVLATPVNRAQTSISSSSRSKPGAPVMPSDSPFFEHVVEDEIITSPVKTKQKLLDGSPVRYRSKYMHL